mgnify:CR=1 FL=1
MKVSVIIPAFNEERTIIKLLNNVNQQKKKFDLEIIVSDDGSTDKTKILLEENSNLYDKLILSEVNKGKGCAMRKGIEASTGDILLFQDADMEYDPKDYSKLIKPFIENNADVVYGTRFISSKPRRVIYFTHRLANFLITTMVNFFTNINFSDVETGYKLLRKEVLRSVKLNENSFGIEIEITMKIAKLNLKIFEVGISYNGRTYDEGKKITFKDGLIAFILILKYFFTSAHR